MGSNVSIEAAETLGRRADRVRHAVAWPCVVMGVLAGYVGYLVVREIQFAIIGVNFGWLSAVAGGIPPLMASAFVARWIGRAIVRRRAPTWIMEISNQTGASREELTDIAAYW